MKVAFVLLAVFLSSNLASAQISGLEVGVNGLTCSQCTRNVEMQLRKLPFVLDVRMNLAHTDGFIALKEGSRIEPEKVVKAVKDAGFSVRFLNILVAHPAPMDWKNGCVKISELNFQLVGKIPVALPDTLSLQLLGAAFQPRKSASRLPPKTCPVATYFIKPISQHAS